MGKGMFQAQGTKCTETLRQVGKTRTQKDQGNQSKWVLLAQESLEGFYKTRLPGLPTEL